MDNRYGRVEWGQGKPRSQTKTYKDVRKWNKRCKDRGIRERVFCASLADWLDEEINNGWRENLFDLIEECEHLDWLMLTKRIQNYNDMVPPKWLECPLRHVWVGTTAESQKYWDIRIPILKKIPAYVRWVSYEPALGQLYLKNCDGIHWVIIGGESAQMMPARPFDIGWAETVIAKCRESNIIPFMKQTGSNVLYHGQAYKVTGSGTDPEEWPESVRVREFPQLSGY